MFEGKPMTNAAISFLPESPTAPAANSEVINGEYTFTEELGPTQGWHKVIIIVIQKGKFPGQGKEIPNGDNEYRFEVPAEGPFKKDFTFQQR